MADPVFSLDRRVNAAKRRLQAALDLRCLEESELIAGEFELLRRELGFICLEREQDEFEKVFPPPPFVQRTKDGYHIGQRMPNAEQYNYLLTWKGWRSKAEQTLHGPL